jgi:hypothetical protein
MKKTLLVVVCLLFIGGSLFAQTVDLGAFNLVLADNFEHGIGYQSFVNNRTLLGGQRLETGQSYTLKVKFTLSRDLVDELQVVLIDNTDRARPNAWWSELSEYFVLTASGKAGQEYTATVTLPVTATASGTSVQANALYILTDDPSGTKGRKGSGTRGPVTVSFTEFTWTKN